MTGANSSGGDCMGFVNIYLLKKNICSHLCFHSPVYLILWSLFKVITMSWMTLMMRVMKKK